MTRHFSTTLVICVALFAMGRKLATAQTETVIHSFHSDSDTDGINPYSGLVADSSGALYGTTTRGGRYNFYGTVYKLAPPTTQGGSWKQNILYSFASGGATAPTGNLILTKTGKIYGVASEAQDDSVVFELTPPARAGDPWTESTVYEFYGSYQSLAGVFGLIADGKGKLYGATHDGGRYKSGSVFVLSSTNGFWKEQDLYSFPYNSDELYFPGGLVRDAAGVLYGVTAYGGPPGYDAGTIFSLTPPSSGKGAWTQSFLHTFLSNPGDGYLPAGALVLDSNGALYGTTVGGGQFGNGTVFQLSPPATQGGAWTEALLYSFQGASDGSQPQAGVIFDSTGALYGTTQYGGDFACSYNGGSDGCGTAFKLIPPSTQGGTWTEETLHAFAGGSDGVSGASPLLLLDTTLYGTTPVGGDGEPCYGVGCGIVFQVTQ